MSGNPARRSRGRAAVAAIVFALAACGAPEPPDADRAAPEPQAEPHEPLEIVQPLPERSPSMPTNDEPERPPEPMLAPVLADASSRGDVATDEVIVTGSWRRTWSDGSLGCPQPGMHYTQALVSGWRVLIQAGEHSLDYRLADRGYFLLCPSGLEAGLEPRDER